MGRPYHSCRANDLSVMRGLTWGFSKFWLVWGFCRHHAELRIRVFSRLRQPAPFSSASPPNPVLSVRCRSDCRSQCRLNEGVENAPAARLPGVSPKPPRRPRHRRDGAHLPHRRRQDQEGRREGARRADLQARVRRRCRRLFDDGARVHGAVPALQGGVRHDRALHGEELPGRATLGTRAPR